MQRKIEKSREIIAETFDLPKDIVLNVPKITIIGNDEITIENHKGIILFERNVIKVNTKVKAINIEGENFEILYIGDSTITISGKFKSISYEV
ncbi:sporulation protein YqfC [Clostridium tertium]|jgi:sporulation protein YqfC|uniref:Sporulation protein YqfC n=1 Tax=Clostridium tertium TaxID=1559 RepID=A0A9X4B460_9CLOT|nr:MULTISPECIES: sporulation protein YqfC [Clostridium]EEH98820.1 sporulation protein YqfC [Clostridium sp. 7_2_43FAA]MBP1869558.1 sporulation protein YqfC [Clostridium tertium]MBS5305807.1 sporulation protein YqfC [Clostridium sp.]MBS5885997.1 sporulation protein YqfC [Clostridium sp.]MBS6502417.1 sporulation protein YqfC [Clostridium sp.]